MRESLRTSGKISWPSSPWSIFSASPDWFDWSLIPLSAIPESFDADCILMSLTLLFDISGVSSLLTPFGSVSGRLVSFFSLVLELFLTSVWFSICELSVIIGWSFSKSESVSSCSASFSVSFSRPESLSEFWLSGKAFPFPFLDFLPFRCFLLLFLPLDCLFDLRFFFGDLSMLKRVETKCYQNLMFSYKIC
jgi:hypothetical protein